MAELSNDEQLLQYGRCHILPERAFDQTIGKDVVMHWTEGHGHLVQVRDSGGC